jgi:zinc protease
MYRVLVKDKKLTSRTSAYNRAQELAGTFQVTINANAGTSLADVEDAIFESLRLFEEEGITENDLERIKAGLETEFYNSISSVLMKGFQMARYNEYAGSTSFIEQDIANIQAVTIADIQRVYDTCIKDKPYVATSFVPKGSLDLIAANSVKADVKEESITDATEVAQEISDVEEETENTPSSFDRSVEPEMGPDPVVIPPEVWTGELNNGIRIYGITYDELPLVNYSLVIKGGHLLDEPALSGTAYMVAALMTEGTANKTPEELEEAIEMLGANIRVRASEQSISVNVNTLARNFESTLALVEEIFFEPRWDEEQFELAKSRIINTHKRNRADPSFLSRNTFDNLLFGTESILAIPVDGTIESIEAITMDDLKDYYEAYFSPAISSFHLVGNISPAQVKKNLAGIESRWETREVDLPEFQIPSNPENPRIYFVDVPGAKQSVIRIGNLAFTKDALLKSNAREFETLDAKQGMLETISMYDLPFDFITRQQEVTRSMTLEKHRDLARKYIEPDNMYFLVVGDAATQLEPLKSLGMGTPELVQ